MNEFAVQLEGCSKKELDHLCERHHIASGSLSRSEALGQLTQRISDPNYLWDLLARNRPALRSYLLAVAMLGSHEAVQPGILKEPLDVVAAEAQALGLTDGTSELPIELIQALGRIWAYNLSLKPRRDPAVSLDPAGPAALRHATTILAMAAREELTIGPDGELTPDAQRRMFARAGETGQLPSEPFIYFALQYATFQNLITEGKYSAQQQAGLVITSNAREWVQLDWSTIWADMAFFQLLKQAKDLKAMPLVLHTLLAMPPSGWISLKEVVQQGDLLQPDTPAESAIGHTIARMLVALATLDLTMVISLPQQRDHILCPTMALRDLGAGLSPHLPKPERSFSVRADLEVMAPKTLHPSILYPLAVWAERHTAKDRTVRYQLDRPAIAAASAGEVLAFFASHNKGPLPSQAERTLQEWTASAPSERKTPPPRSEAASADPFVVFGPEYLVDEFLGVLPRQCPPDPRVH